MSVAADVDPLDGTVEAARSVASAAKSEPMSEAEASADDGSSESTQAAQDALAAAKSTGAQVEVPALRTEYATTYANPDGLSFTLEDSAVPVRVKAGDDDGWVAPDATLEVRADGSVGPKAAAVGMSFSDGGDGGDLVSVTREGRTLSLGWAGELPKPVLAGDSALYSEVLPGVDLKLTASVEGFREVLIVKSAQAAASEALSEVSFGLDTTGLDVQETTGGGMQAVDGDGVPVFRSPQAQMWDSAGDAQQSSADAQLTTQLSTRLTTAGEVDDSSGSADSADSADSSGGASVADGADGPADGSAIALLPLDVSDDELSLTPDAELVENATYPLYIDPTVTWSEAERTLLRSDGYADYAWTNGDDDEGKGMGYCGTYVTGGYSYYCGSGYKQRLYFEFAPTSLKGKHVLDATFRATESWSMSCTASWVDLTRTNGISSSSDWPGPTHLDLMVDRYVSAGRGSACDPSQPNAAIEFNDNAAETNENLTATVKSFAAGNFSRLPLMLKAHDETDPNSWKRFKNDAVLSVKYVGLPATPTGVGIVTGDGTVCERDADDPAIVSDPTPSLAATAQTKSGGENDASLRIAFDLDQRSSTGTWSNVTAGNGSERPSSGYAGDNAKVTLAWSTLSEDVLYRYRAWVRSYYNDGASWLSGSSNASTTGWCYFQVDPTRPLKPTIAIASPYSACTANACAAAGGPGIAATFTFGPADGDANVAYQYKLSTETAWSSAISGTKVTKAVTPDVEGTYRLYARAEDSLGRWGAQNLIDFRVSDGEAPQAEYHFDEASGAAVDSGTGVDADADDLTLSSTGVTRDGRGRRGTDPDTGAEDTSLLLDGGSGYAQTDGPVLDTGKSYTASAWVRLDDLSKTQMVLSQSGAYNSPFYVLYNATYGYWGMITTGDNSDDPPYTVYYMVAPVAANTWTHVSFVYNATAGTMRLIVNGKWYIEKAAAAPWASTGALRVGPALFNGAYSYPLHGSVDEVRTWQRALSWNEVVRDARLLNPTTGDQYVELAAHWDAATAAGGATSLADSSGYGRTLTVSGGGATDGEAIVLDGTDDAASSDAAVDDTGSFTVTAVVDPDLEALAAKGTGYVAQVVGKRDKDGTSNWGVFFEVTGRTTVAIETTDGDIVEKTVATGFWHFGRYNDDGTFTAQVSEEATTDSGQVRITGVFNQQDVTAALYLNDNVQYTTVSYTTDSGKESLAVGNGYTAGAWGHWLPGSVSELRLWAGAASDTDQITSMVGE
ncbi:LamG domain-containing protein [Streptomyces prunicolor]|uniref:LamG domain-containing protein n=1 Tax=Streptomyces prunicolor TaxID=67348 RepID=UPI001FDFC142|nr:LamG domain-containing protein [Streptomyces prunicolor]